MIESGNMSGTGPDVEAARQELRRRRESLVRAAAALEETGSALALLAGMGDVALSAVYGGRVQFPLYGLAQNVSVLVPEEAAAGLVRPCLEVTEYILEGKRLKRGERRTLERLRCRLVSLREAMDGGEEVVHPMADTVAYLQAYAPEKTGRLVEALARTCAEGLERIRVSVENYNALRL